MCFPTCDTLRLLACVAQYKPTNHIHPNSTLGSGRRPPTPIATEITISNRRPLQSPLRGSRCAQPRPPPTPSLPTPPSPTSPRPASLPLSPPPSPSPKLKRATPPLPRPILPDTPITPPPPSTSPPPYSTPPLAPAGPSARGSDRRCHLLHPRVRLRGLGVGSNAWARRRLARASAARSDEPPRSLRSEPWRPRVRGGNAAAHTAHRVGEISSRSKHPLTLLTHPSPA